MENLNIVGISGSLRKHSYNTSLLEEMKKELEAHNSSLEILEIGDLPLFSQDLEENFPEAATTLKEKIRAADGVIVLTPEYNRGVSGVLKNAIDWSSRPYSEQPWKEKKVFVGGAGTSGSGTAIAQSHLKHTFLHLNARVLGQPEFFVGRAKGKFDESSNLTDEDTKGFITKAMQAFGEFVKVN